MVELVVDMVVVWGVPRLQEAVLAAVMEYVDPLVLAVLLIRAIQEEEGVGILAEAVGTKKLVLAEDPVTLLEQH